MFYRITKNAGSKNKNRNLRKTKAKRSQRRRRLKRQALAGRKGRYLRNLARSK